MADTALREALLADLRSAVARAQLDVLELKVVGVALKHNLITNEQALELANEREVSSFLALLKDHQE